MDDKIEKMKEKIITIKPKGISQKQWSNLLLELNLMKRAWKPYGVDMQISAPGLKNILKWGTRSYDKPKETR
jgi:hypothetical protein